MGFCTVSWVFLIELRCSNSCVQNVGYVARSCSCTVQPSGDRRRFCVGRALRRTATCISGGLPMSQDSALPRSRIARKCRGCKMISQLRTLRLSVLGDLQRNFPRSSSSSRTDGTTIALSLSLSFSLALVCAIKVQCKFVP